MLIHSFIRLACAWCLNRVSSGRDGVDILFQSGLIKTMISSFLQYSEILMEENGHFLISLMESFINIFQYDNGIQFFLGSGLMKRLNLILTSPTFIEFKEKFSHRINYL